MFTNGPKMHAFFKRMYLCDLKGLLTIKF